MKRPVFKKFKIYIDINVFLTTGVERSRLKIVQALNIRHAYDFQ